MFSNYIYALKNVVSKRLVLTLVTLHINCETYIDYLFCHRIKNKFTKCVSWHMVQTLFENKNKSFDVASWFRLRVLPDLSRFTFLQVFIFIYPLKYEAFCIYFIECGDIFIKSDCKLMLTFNAWLSGHGDILHLTK